MCSVHAQTVSPLTSLKAAPAHSSGWQSSKSCFRPLSQSLIESHWLRLGHMPISEPIFMVREIWRSCWLSWASATHSDPEPKKQSQLHQRSTWDDSESQMVSQSKIMILVREEKILLGSKNKDIHSSLCFKISVSLGKSYVKMLVRSAGHIVKKIPSNGKYSFGKIQVEMIVTFIYTEFPLMLSTFPS